MKEDKMIKSLPFKFINAITDIKNKIIYISCFVKNDDIADVMKDEFAHIMSGSNKHGEKWKETCEKLYGCIPSHNASMDDELLPEFGMNIGNITGIQNMLLDYHMLQSYRKFSQRVLGTEGSWEVTGDNKLVLKPVPKGSFPVVVRYLPSIDTFHLPAAKELCTRMMIAECKQIIGHTRRKINVAGPGGDNISMDGDALVQEGAKEAENIIKLAIEYGEPLGFIAQ